MAYTKDELLALVREAGSEMTLRQKLRLTVLLSIPAIIAHFSIIAMQMIEWTKEQGDVKSLII